MPLTLIKLKHTFVDIEFSAHDAFLE